MYVPQMIQPASSDTKSQELRQLRDILTTALEELEDVTGRKSPNGSWPSLDMPINHTPNQNHWEPHQDTEVQRLSNLIIAAAYQLINLVREPFASLADAACGSLLTAALNTANELNIAEILRRHGQQGVDILEIAARCHADPEKLGRCLRILATHHIFREVRPNVFALNRISSLLDTGVPHERLRENKPSQLNKYDEYTGHNDISAYIGHFASDVTRASLYHLDDVRAGAEPHPSSKRTPFQKALKTSENLFSWMQDPTHKYEFSRHNACIRATAQWHTSEALLSGGFDWGSLAEGSLVVDVGGGMGRPAVELAKASPRLTFIVQDQESVAQKALEHWKNNEPEILSNERVSFSAHDFFQIQPIVGADIYLARIVFHDWDDDHVIQILKRLREAASSTSRLIIADYITPFASKTAPSTQFHPIQQGSLEIDLPPPLLSNLGKANANTYYLDIAMQLLLDGKERTLPQHVQVLQEARWKAVAVRFAANSNFGFIVAEPI